jgi:hypothetical protein
MARNKAMRHLPMKRNFPVFQRVISGYRGTGTVRTIMDRS